jgi:hypothetical protein
VVLARGAQAQGEFPVNAFDQAGQIGNWALAPTERTQPFTYGVDAGVGETDNVSLVPTDKVSQTLATVDTDFTVHERSRLLEADALGDFSYIDYLQGAYGPQLIGRFDGVGNLAIIPGNLVWTLRDDFGKAALDPYTPVTPNNMESVNYISTGPDLALRVGGVNFIDLSARYARAQYQTSPFNSNRLLGSAAFGRDVSAGGSVSLNVTTERVLFDNTQVNADFERSSGFVRYEVHGARTDIIAELGATNVRSSAIPDAELADADTYGMLVAPAPTVNSGKQSNTGPLAKLDLRRKISASGSVFLTLGRDLTDASSSFSAQTTGIAGINATTAAAQTSESYRTTYASAGWRYVRNRTTLAIAAHWEKDVYPYLSQYDYSRPSVDFTVERRLTRAFTAQLIGRWYKADYPHSMLIASPVGGSTDYYDSLVGASLAWRHGRGLEVRLRLDHDTYSVNTGDTGYHETRAFLTVGYRPLAAPPAEDTATP